MKSVAVRKEKQAVTFEALVREAAAVALEVKALDTLEGFKLTAKDFLREAIAVARTTPERLAALRQEMEGGKPGLDHARQTLRKMIVLFRSRNATRPARELRRYNFLHTAEAIAELAAIGSSTFECAALAVQIAGERYPEAFGTATSSEGVKTKLVELTLKRDELFARVGSEWTPADVEDHDIDNEKGTARTCFRMTKGEVAIHPLEDAGRRLVDWWISHHQD